MKNFILLMMIIVLPLTGIASQKEIDPKAYDLFDEALKYHNGYSVELNLKKADFEKNWLGWVEFMKVQIELQTGLKSLSSLDFMEISKDWSKDSYNEHVMAFSNTVSRLFDVFSRGLADNMSWENIQKSVRDVINDNSSAEDACSLEPSDNCCELELNC